MRARFLLALACVAFLCSCASAPVAPGADTAFSVGSEVAQQSRLVSRMDASVQSIAAAAAEIQAQAKSIGAPAGTIWKPAGEISRNAGTISTALADLKESIAAVAREIGSIRKMQAELAAEKRRMAEIVAKANEKLIGLGFYGGIFGGLMSIAGFFIWWLVKADAAKNLGYALMLGGILVVGASVGFTTHYEAFGLIAAIVGGLAFLGTVFFVVKTAWKSHQESKTVATVVAALPIDTKADLMSTVPRAQAKIIAAVDKVKATVSAVSSPPAADGGKL
ncbi:MAG: hypothetical protein K8R92_00785 [Planctomycetes bacterium]|nr:hypothetical protein [Planctomycetota bacterium]